MLEIKNKYRIEKLDSLNYTYSIYKLTEAKKIKEPYYTWIRSLKYYGSLRQTLEAIKKDIIDNLFNTQDYTEESLLKALEELITAIDNIEITLKEKK